jgi:hypothetical protein
MNTRLQELYDKIESQRHSLLLVIKDLPNDRLNRTVDGKWSINQIISHLIAAERLSIQYLNKKILGVNEAVDSGFLEELKMLALTISQRMPFKFKAPRVVVEHTTFETDLVRLAQEWNKTRDELRVLLDRMDDRHLKRMIYKHVRVGMLNIEHALRFFGEHVGHHTPQIKYLLKKK